MYCATAVIKKEWTGQPVHVKHIFRVQCVDHNQLWGKTGPLFEPSNKKKKAAEWRKGMHAAGWETPRQRGNKAAKHTCDMTGALCVKRRSTSLFLQLKVEPHLYFTWQSFNLQGGHELCWFILQTCRYFTCLMQKHNLQRQSWCVSSIIFVT